MCYPHSIQVISILLFLAIQHVYNTSVPEDLKPFLATWVIAQRQKNFGDYMKANGYTDSSIESSQGYTVRLTFYWADGELGVTNELVVGAIVKKTLQLAGMKPKVTNIFKPVIQGGLTFGPNKETIGDKRELETKYTLLKRALVAEQLKVLSSTVSALAKITYTIDGNQLRAQVEYTDTLGQNGTKDSNKVLSSTGVTYTKC